MSAILNILTFLKLDGKIKLYLFVIAASIGVFRDAGAGRNGDRSLNLAHRQSARNTMAMLTKSTFTRGRSG